MMPDHVTDPTDPSWDEWDREAPPAHEAPDGEPDRFEPVHHGSYVEPDDNAPEGVVPLGYDRGVFFYLSRSARQVFALSATQHNKNNLMAMASLPHFWERGQFKTEKGGVRWDEATDWLMRECRAVGIYSPDIVRGRGAWLDQGRPVLHMGDHLIVGDTRSDLRLPGSRHVYEAAQRFSDVVDVAPLPARKAHQLVTVCRSLRWERGISGTLLAGFIAIAPVCGGLVWRPSIWITGGKGSGKAQPHSSPVLTPYGWKPMGSLKVGNMVSTPGSGTARIMAVHPQGEQDIYRLTFTDGRQTRATADHLWKVRVGGQWKLRTTSELIAILDKGTQMSTNLAVPVCAPQSLNRDKFILPMHPYALGALLGDGHLANADGAKKAGEIFLTSTDQHIFDRVAAVLGNNVTLHPCNRKITMRLGSLDRYGKDARNLIRELRLLGTRSHDKFVPAPYLSASIEERTALLQGLMDTDGTVGAKGGLSFCSVSEQLARDVQYLVRSLGGCALISTRQPFYIHNGAKLAGRTAFVVSIRLPDPRVAFTLPRKLERLENAYQYADTFYLGIESIEADGREDASCIAIDDPDRLYLTDDFVVTHNTWAEENVIAPAIGQMALRVLSNTTEPGIRRELKSDARPVLFDEAEQEDAASVTRFQAVLGLVRQSSSEGGGSILKAAQGDGVARFRVRSCFAFSSINVGLVHGADESRITVLAFREPELDGTEARRADNERFERLAREVATTISPEFSAALLARSVRLLPVIRQNAETFARAVSIHLGSRRLGDQLGTLLAGAFSLHADRLVTMEEAEAFIKREEWEREVEQSDERDEQKLLARLTQARITFSPINGGTLTMAIGRLISCVAGVDNSVSSEAAGRELLERGIRYWPGNGPAQPEGITVSSNHTELGRILKDTPWSAGWQNALARLPGAVRHPTSVRFGPGQPKSRGVFLPLTLIDRDHNRSRTGAEAA